MCFSFPRAFHSVKHCYNNCPGASGILYWAAVHPEILNPDSYWSWFASVHLQIIYVATFGLRSQVGFDAIPIWFIGYIYFENEPALPSTHGLISQFQVHWAWHALLSYVKLCWSTFYSWSEYCSMHHISHDIFSQLIVFQTPIFTKCTPTGAEGPVGLSHHTFQLCLLCQSLVQKLSNILDLGSQLHCLSREGWFLLDHLNPSS
jgi:hypothetical protein